MQIQKQLDKSESSRSITAHLTAAQGILLHIFIWPAGVGLFYSIECRSICYFDNATCAQLRLLKQCSVFASRSALDLDLVY
jgi:hypothetical protein